VKKNKPPSALQRSFSSDQVFFRKESFGIFSYIKRPKEAYTPFGLPVIYSGSAA